LSEGDGHAVELCDVSKPAEIAKLAERAGRLDGLIHSAGVAPMVPVGLADADGMAGVFDVNCFSFIELMKHYSKEKNRLWCKFKKKIFFDTPVTTKRVYITERNFVIYTILIFQACIRK
jgi:NAD(P)-dependent dehydrogenase (short-subunit alcohol dehydrogenase family)